MATLARLRRGLPAPRDGSVSSVQAREPHRLARPFGMPRSAVPALLLMALLGVRHEAGVAAGVKPKQMCLAACALGSLP
jgi:hypothetical protein